MSYIRDAFAIVKRRNEAPGGATSNDFHESEYQRLWVGLQAAHDASQLPELPSDETRAALNDLLVRIRLIAQKNQKERNP